MVAYSYSPGTQEVEAGTLQVLFLFGPHREVLFLKKVTYIRFNLGIIS